MFSQFGWAAIVGLLGRLVHRLAGRGGVGLEAADFVAGDAWHLGDGRRR